MATATVPVTTTVTDASLLTIEQNIVQRTNSQRLRHGLPPLQIDHQLMGSARRHAMWMARNRVMQHTSATVAENIAAGQHSSDQVVSDWMNSSGHRANILSSRYSRIGVAAYRGRDGQIYWCQQFLW
jgi:uncharacterized protein YkwD